VKVAIALTLADLADDVARALRIEQARTGTPWTEIAGDAINRKLAGPRRAKRKGALSA